MTSRWSIFIQQLNCFHCILYWRIKKHKSPPFFLDRAVLTIDLYNAFCVHLWRNSLNVYRNKNSLPPTPRTRAVERNATHILFPINCFCTPSHSGVNWRRTGRLSLRFRSWVLTVSRLSAEQSVGWVLNSQQAECWQSAGSSKCLRPTRKTKSFYCA